MLLKVAFFSIMYYMIKHGKVLLSMTNILHCEQVLTNIAIQSFEISEYLEELNEPDLQRGHLRNFELFFAKSERLKKHHVEDFDYDIFIEDLRKLFELNVAQLSLFTRDYIIVRKGELSENDTEQYERLKHVYERLQNIIKIFEKENVINYN